MESSNRPGSPLRLPDHLSEEERRHLDDVADNLQLVADMGYGDVALAVEDADVRDAGVLRIVADARPTTAVSAVAASRVGTELTESEEPEAYKALGRGEPVPAERWRSTRGLSYTTSAYPVGSAAVLIRDLTQQVVEAPGKMERAFMEIAEELVEVLGDGPLVDIRDGGPFSARRQAGDGVVRIGADGSIGYASPNAINILRAAGASSVGPGELSSTLPGSAVAVSPVLTSGAGGAYAVEIDAAGHTLSYRTIALGEGAFVLVEDITEQRRREQELKVKEATIREVHHRVKNNLQTIASLLRIQERRTDSEEASRALGEADERIGSMASVHELLAGSTQELVDFAEVAGTVVDMVRRGLVEPDSEIRVLVEGSTGEVDAAAATSLALVVVELVHNAIEHGLEGRETGHVTVTMRRLPEEVLLIVRDDGAGLPRDFSLIGSAHLGLEIVRTIVEDDLGGTLSLGTGKGTSVTIRVPLERASRRER
jgi:two-component sensor histidine kinase